MAIRSTNANRAAKAYNPNAQAASRNPRQPPRNTDGPGNSHLDYGPPKPFNQRDQYEAAKEKWGLSPWYGRSGERMPWGHPEGQERGQRAPFFTPDAGDPRNAGYWVAPPSAEEQAAYDADAKQRFADQKSALMQDPRYSSAWDAYQQVKGRGGREEANAMKAVQAAQIAAKQAAQQQRFIDQGGRPETWQGRFQNENNWPRPGVGGAVPAPSPAPAPAPGGGRTMPQALPPSQNPMFEGYSPGVPMNQSKSGMGQSPRGNEMVTGNAYFGPDIRQSGPMGGGPMGDPFAEMQARGLRIGGPPMGGGFSPGVSMMDSRPMGGSYIGGPESGLSSWFRQQQGGSPMGAPRNYMARPGEGLSLQNQMMTPELFARFGGMGGFGSGGFGGYNPMAQGNPFAALSGMFF